MTINYNLYTKKGLKMVKVWFQDGKGWLVQVGEDAMVYVYPTKRSALNAVEAELDNLYGK
jgi:hypothetical protein